MKEVSLAQQWVLISALLLAQKVLDIQLVKDLQLKEKMYILQPQKAKKKVQWLKMQIKSFTHQKVRIIQLNFHLFKINFNFRKILSKSINKSLLLNFKRKIEWKEQLCLMHHLHSKAFLRKILKIVFHINLLQLMPLHHFLFLLLI